MIISDFITLLGMNPCEVDAISFEREPGWRPACKSSNPGARKWYVDGEKCYQYWCENGTDCSTCVAVCPFNTGPVEASSKEFWEKLYASRHAPMIG